MEKARTVYIEEILPIMKKIFGVFYKNRELLTEYPKTNSGEKNITVQNLEDLAGNHLFDDHPELFGISKIEGHKIRAYFQERAWDGCSVTGMYENFADFLEGENEDYLKKIDFV